MQIQGLYTCRSRWVNWCGSTINVERFSYFMLNTHLHQPHNIKKIYIFEALQIHTMAGPLHAMLLKLQYSTHRTLSHSHKHQQLALFCVLTWAPKFSNILTLSTIPHTDAYIRAVHPTCQRNGIHVFVEGQT